MVVHDNVLAPRDVAVSRHRGSLFGNLHNISRPPESVRQNVNRIIYSYSVLIGYFLRGSCVQKTVFAL